MPSRLASVLLTSLIALSAVCPGLADPPTVKRLIAPGVRDAVEIIRDDYGVAHVYASNDFDLFFGYGFAAAEDRMFQMDLIRRSVAGRLAEILGDRPMSAPADDSATGRRRGRRAGGRRDQKTTLDHDRVVRVWGLYEHAARTFAQLSPATRTACEGYAAGVNHYLATHRGRLLYLFDRLGYVPEPWTAVDAAACWNQIVIKLGGQWLNAARRSPRPANRPRRPAPRRYGAEHDDESDCHISEDEMRGDREVYDELMRIKARQKARESAESQAATDRLDAVLASLDLSDLDTPRMSHAWAVGAKRSATGHAILESDPQLSVTMPSAVYEIHLHGGDYNVRGISIPGSPGFLVGRSGHLAWGATAAGGHYFNLYRETVHPDDPNQVRHQGRWEPVRVRREIIKVKGGSDVPLTIRHTRHGPVVNDLLPTKLAAARTLALAHVVTSAATSSVQGLLALGRAKSWDDFRAALRDYHAPAANFIVVDRAGRVSYTLGASAPHIPAGLSNDVLDGAAGPFDWHSFEDGDHRGPFLPHRLLPHAFDIERGDIASANNTSIGRWYPLDLGFRGRDTDRSIRLREMLAARDKHSVQDFMSMHADMESPMPRTFIRTALAMFREQPPESETLRQAERILRKWDGRMVVEPRAWPLVSTVARKLHRYVNMRDWPELARQYGPGPIAAATLAKRFRPMLTEGKTPTDVRLRRAILELIESSMRDVAEQYGTDETRWTLPPTVRAHALPYQAGLLSLGSFDRSRDRSVQFPCVAIQTIRSPRGNCYSILAEMGDIDNNWSILTPGISEDPASPHFADQIADWKAARLHRAYMSRPAVMKVATAHVVLRP